MKRESRLSGVPALLRPDKLELLSREIDREPVLKPLELEGVRADGEESLEIVFLLMLLPVLSSDEEVSLLEEEEEEPDNAGLTEDFLTVSGLRTPDPIDVLKLLSMGADFLASETLLVRIVGFAEGKELLLSCGRDCFTGSETAFVFPPEPVVVFWSFVAETDSFSGAPPVLFLLVTGTELVLREDAVVVVTFEIESEVFFGLLLFGAKRFEVAEMVGFVVLETFMEVSTELTEDCCFCLSEVGAFLAPSSPSGSSIFKLNKPDAKSEEEDKAKHVSLDSNDGAWIQKQMQLP